MDICYATSYPLEFPIRIKCPLLENLNFIVTKLKNQDKKVASMRFDEDGELAISSEFIKTCQNINNIVQTTGGDKSSLSGKSEIPNITHAFIKTDLLLKSSHKNEL